MPSQLVISLGLAHRYIRKIRNKQKRAYADDYLNFMRGQCVEPVAHYRGLSYMAAQAVRLELTDILGDVV